MRKKVTVVGSGNVGATAAQGLCRTQSAIFSRLVLHLGVQLTLTVRIRRRNRREKAKTPKIAVFEVLEI